MLVFPLSVGMEVLHVEKLQLIDALLNLCAYRHPEKIALPKGSVLNFTECHD